MSRMLQTDLSAASCRLLQLVVCMVVDKNKAVRSCLSSGPNPTAPPHTHTLMFFCTYRKTKKNIFHTTTGLSDRNASSRVSCFKTTHTAVSSEADTQPVCIPEGGGASKPVWLLTGPAEELRGNTWTGNRFHHNTWSKTQ